MLHSPGERWNALRVILGRVFLLAGLLALVASAGSIPAGANQQTVGLFVNDAGSFEGYTLFKPILFGTTYLIDNDGRLVHSWETPGGGVTPYLLEDGSVIRLGGYGVQQLAWDGTSVWDYGFADGFAHHDIEPLPNGNVLIIIRESKMREEVIAAGRNPALLEDDELQPESIIEVEPPGTIVWEWHSWDHLVQDFDPEAENRGVVAAHPELIDVNFIEATRPPGGEADWHHSNAIDYNEELDQIVLSVRHFSELWVIDHSTTTEEAASHSGGDSGKGGDLLYRWGNPQAYGAGGPADQKLFLQHDAQWIEAGLPGEGNILIFNNGNGRPGGDYSSVEEIAPPIDEQGNYTLAAGQAYGPLAPNWIYTAEQPAEFYADIMSSTQRLPNGNTLINSSPQGRIFEVTADGTIVWEYINPVTDHGPLHQGDPIPATSNQVFKAFRFGPDYPGLQGRDLTPGDFVELGVKDPARLLGDVDGDGFVTSLDALLILQFNAAFLPTLVDLESADVNEDGEVDSLDAVLVLQISEMLL